MKQYDNLESAIFALIQNRNTRELYNQELFIALLSDYAPNLLAEQKVFRRFVRENGFSPFLDGILHNREIHEVLLGASEAILKSSEALDDASFLFGIIVSLALELNPRLSEKLLADSIYEIGMNYYRKVPKERYIPIALAMLDYAGKHGKQESYLYIAKSYIKGKEINQDVEKGLHYLQLASDNGCMRATLELAEILYKGELSTKDNMKAVKLLSSLDDSNAYFMLAEIYKDERENNKAFDCYLKAAEKGHVYAQYTIALAYATGQGVKRSIGDAKRWLHSAASLGHSEARKKLEELGEKWV